MRGPYRFEKDDGTKTFKYKIGDWVHGERSGTFWKITDRRLESCVLPWPHDNYYNLPGYHVADYGQPGQEMTERGLRHWGDQSTLERDIRPLTDPRDVLLCRASDIKAQHYELSQQVKKLGEDFDATMRTRELLE